MNAYSLLQVKSLKTLTGRKATKYINIYNISYLIFLSHWWVCTITLFKTLNSVFWQQKHSTKRKDSFFEIQPKSEFLRSTILSRKTHIHFYERSEVQPGVCRLGHEEKEEGVQARVKAAQTHGCFKVHVEAVCSSQEQQHVVGEVQDPGGGEAQQEDDKHQRAGLDI